MLSNWLLPVNESQNASYYSDIFSCQGNFPDLTNAKIVVFSRERAFSGAVRNEMNKLFNHFSVPIIDIGNLNTQNTSSAYQVISELQDGYILPVLVGVDENAFYEFCKALVKEERLNTCAYISNKLAISTNEYNIENIGFQRHFVPKHQYLDVAESNTPGLSLGLMRSNQKVLEPILRECNYVHFDLAAVRSSDCAGTLNGLPTGLYSEEACQIMRYAGEGLRLKLVTIDSSALNSESQMAAMLVAELIWYLHEGVEHRGKDHPALSSDFKEYIIELNEFDHSLVFAQSTASGKWWLKLDNDSNRYVSCAYEEYQKSINNEIPDRLLKLL